MSDTRLHLLLAAAADAQKELERHRDGLVEVHVPMALRPRVENIPEPEVRAEVRRLDRLLTQLRRALQLYAAAPETITCRRCGTTRGMHYGNCPAATAATTIKGPAE